MHHVIDLELHVIVPLAPVAVGVGVPVGPEYAHPLSRGSVDHSAEGACGEEGGGRRGAGKGGGGGEDSAHVHPLPDRWRHQPRRRACGRGGGREGAEGVGEGRIERGFSVRAPHSPVVAPTTVPSEPAEGGRRGGEGRGDSAITRPHRRLLAPLQKNAPPPGGMGTWGGTGEEGALRIHLPRLPARPTSHTHAPPHFPVSRGEGGG